MLIELQPSLSPLADWIRSADAHASYHLPLLVRAQRVLGGVEKAGDSDRQELADRLERWRYQLANLLLKSPSPLGQRLVDVLDLAGNELCGRTRRPPRCPRNAVSDTFRFPEALVRALGCLRGETPLDAVEKQATDLTDTSFSANPLKPSIASDRAREPVVEFDIADVGPTDTLGEATAEAVGNSTPASETPSDDGDAKHQPAAEAAAAQGATGRGVPAARRMLLYAPLYLSSHCINYCVYCNFRYPSSVERRHLTLEDALRQAELLARRGIRHILLVAGDFPKLTSLAYLTEIIHELTERGFSVSVEVAPQTTSAYAALAAAGAIGVTLYQETYNETLYALYHPHGPKADFDWRLEGLERAAEAGMVRLGLGILLGLADPREDVAALIRHGRYLEQRFPDRTLAFSLPRLHDTPVNFEPPYPVDDETFVRLYCTLRSAFPTAELTLSTREGQRLRNRLSLTCVTQLSAGSSTVPGGYEDGEPDSACAGQFPVADRRSPEELAAWLRAAGLDVRWEVC